MNLVNLMLRYKTQQDKSGSKFDLALPCVISNAPTQWQALLAAQSTLVFYMGKEQAPSISIGLLDAQCGANLPVAFVTNGGRPNQIVTYATVASMADAALTIKDSGPTLIIIGDVVSVGQQLNALLADIDEPPLEYGYEALYA